MKYFLLPLCLLFPALASAQTPNLYTTWSPVLFGSKIQFTIQEHHIFISTTAEGMSPAIAQILTIPGPSGNATSPLQSAMHDPVAAKTDTLELLKVVFDSAQSKGRMFIQYEFKRQKSYGLAHSKKLAPMRFALGFTVKDDGQLLIGCASDPTQGLEYTYNKKAPKPLTLAELERQTSPKAKLSTKKPSERSGVGIGAGMIKNISLLFFNSARSQELAKLKDPAMMPSAEAVSLAHSFGDRLVAALSRVEIDSDMMNGYAGLISNIIVHSQNIIYDLFLAHGYNPLAAGSTIASLQGDWDFSDAVDEIETKLVQSVPALRERQMQLDSFTRDQREKEIANISVKDEAANRLRNLAEIKTPVYDETGTLSKTESDALEEQLRTIRKEHRIQITVVLVKSLDGIKSLEPDQTSNAAEVTHGSNTVAREVALDVLSWNKVGDKCSGKGATILLAKNDRQGYIATRYGLEQKLSNEDIANIFATVLTPSLKKGEYYNGLSKSIDAIVHLAIAPPKPPVPTDSVTIRAHEAIPAPPSGNSRTGKENTAVSSNDGMISEELTQSPEPLKNIQDVIVYPAEARSSRLEGKVTYSALIGKDGKVIKVSIVKSENFLFKQPVIDALMKTQFKPAMKGNQPVRVWYTSTVNFKLDTAK